MKVLNEDFLQQNNNENKVELWAGIECTYNRVGDKYFSQLHCNGHISRIEDLDKFAALGIKMIRYPVLWEMTAPEHPQQLDWSWADERLPYLQKLGICPIVGLVHHGSGPSYTNLTDPSFVPLFTEYALALAGRYPWVEYFTPVNEPLTTARFSGMYGHWYPHGKDDETFAKVLLTECKATICAMQAIRQVNPIAKLVLTEDLGKTFSTPLLTYQADLENERRWLSIDLLCGKLTRDKPMWAYLRSCRVSEDELEWFLENPCPPDIIGINHYLTSERFLDERLERYPAATHGGNGIHQYADVEAVRVLMPGNAGPQVLLQETWDRYHLPIAITEAHLSCTREEQLRWLKQIWMGAQILKKQGVDIRAVTVWSLLGSYNWNSLVTCDNNYYEPGVYDLRSPEPRPTALAHMAQSLLKDASYHHPVLDTKGWWQRPDRLLYPPVRSAQDAVAGLEAKAQDSDDANQQPGLYNQEDIPHQTNSYSSPGHRLNKVDLKPLLITGAEETLGKAVARLCKQRAIPYRLLPDEDIDITDQESVTNVIKQYNPWAVVHTAGFHQIDKAQQEPDICYKLNAHGAYTVASACALYNIPLLTFSSSQVFDGYTHTPYTESSQVSPANIYGRSMAAAENQVRKIHSGALIIRTGPLFCPWDETNSLSILLRTLLEGFPVAASADRLFSAAYVPDLVDASLDLLIDGESGLWHLANGGAVTVENLLKKAATIARWDASLIEQKPSYSLNDLTAPQPIYSVLGSERGVLLPDIDNAIARFCSLVQ